MTPACPSRFATVMGPVAGCVGIVARTMLAFLLSCTPVHDGSVSVEDYINLREIEIEIKRESDRGSATARALRNAPLGHPIRGWTCEFLYIR